MSEKLITAENLFELLSGWGELRLTARLYFRGEKAIHRRLKFPLQPSLVREATRQLLAPVWPGVSSPKELEDRLIQRYTRYTAHLIESDGEFAGRTMKQLEVLCLAQHHGLPTLLMDWSLNPLVGLYFALARDDTGDLVDGPGRLWVVQLLPPEDREDMTIHLEDPLTQQDIKDKVDAAMEAKSPLIVVPLVFTKRIAAQDGRFVYCPHARNSGYSLASGSDNDNGPVPWNTLEDYTIPDDADAKRKLLNVITYIGFHPGRIFPDLSGWAKYLRQGYK